MTIADERPGTARLAPAPTDERVDERSSRATLRDQIARLERALAAETPAGRAATSRAAPVAGPRLLDLGELERVRDDLAARVGAARDVVARRARDVAAHRARLDAMIDDPAAHRGAVVTAEDLGEPGCRRWCVRPVLGPVGRLAGWWRVRVSSGCP